MATTRKSCLIAGPLTTPLSGCRADGEGVGWRQGARLAIAVLNRLAHDERNAVILDVRRSHEEGTAVVVWSDEPESP